MEVARYAREGRDVVLIGHAGHPEVEGTMGRFDTGNGGHMHLIENVEQARRLEVRDAARLAFVTQTTLSVDDYRRHRQHPARAVPDAGQSAARGHLLRTAESSGRGEGTDRELATCLSWSDPSPARTPTACASSPNAPAVPAISIDDASFLKREWFEGKKAVGVTAGASAPKSWCSRSSRACASGAAAGAEELKGREEHVVFSLPRALRVAQQPRE
jgi:4-hydroxy-3-methylbut-2-enyl diphosphate reductase